MEKELKTVETAASLTKNRLKCQVILTTLIVSLVLKNGFRMTQVSVTFSATYSFILKRARDQCYQIATTVFLDFLDFFLATRLLDF